MLKIFFKYETIGLSCPVHLGLDNSYLGNYSCHPTYRFLKRKGIEKKIFKSLSKLLPLGDFSVNTVWGAPILLRTSLIKKIGFFDNNFLADIKNITYDKCVSLMMSIDKETNIKFPGAMQKPNIFWDFIVDNKLKGISSKNCITAHASGSFSEFLWEFNDDECKRIMIDELAKLVNLLKSTL